MNAQGPESILSFLPILMLFLGNNPLGVKLLAFLKPSTPVKNGDDSPKKTAVDHLKNILMSNNTL
jgi:hypothetical protein